MTTVTITIDGREVKTEAGKTVLEAAEAAGFDIPKLCHHEQLKPAGACRMCLVEIEKQRALQPACTFPVSDGLVIHTESPKVVDARKFVLQLLFSERNHYCMFCQMSGNCELQDLAYRYKMDHWTYDRGYPKVGVDSTREYFVMDHNRCIVCRRCIRGCAELVGNHTLGLRQRGAYSMLTADMDQPFGQSSCLSCGTCLQLCPTGALMDRTSAYGGVEEQVQRVKTTCQFCSTGCAEELIVRDNHVLRVENDWAGAINRGMLCVKGRFEPLFDRRRRVTTPMVRKKGKLQPATWDEALRAAADGLKGMNGSLGAVVSTRVTNEAAAQFAKSFGTGAKVGTTAAPSFTVIQAEGDLTAIDTADLYILVGCDLSKDWPVVGFAVRRGVTNRGARLVVIDAEGNGMAELAYREFRPANAAQALPIAQGASQVVVLYGPAAGAALATLRDGLKGKGHFVSLVPGVNTRGLQASGLAKKADLAGAKGLFVLAGDEMVDVDVSGAGFVVWMGGYEAPSMDKVNVFLPSVIWTERAGTMTNTEGRVQAVVPAVVPPSGVQADEQVLSALADRMA